MTASAVRKLSSHGTDGQGHERSCLGGLQSKLNQNVYLLIASPAVCFSLQAYWLIDGLRLDFGMDPHTIPFAVQIGAQMFMVSLSGHRPRLEMDDHDGAHAAAPSGADLARPSWVLLASLRG